MKLKILRCTGSPMFYEEISRIDTEFMGKVTLGYAVNHSAFYIFPEVEHGGNQHFFAVPIRHILEEAVRMAEFDEFTNIKDK